MTIFKRKTAAGRLVIKTAFFHVLTGAAAAALICGQTVFAGEKKINSGISIGGVDVSGMTQEEARQAVEAKVASSGAAEVDVTVGDTQLSTTLRDLGLKWKNTDVLDQAMDLGSCGNIVQRYKDQKDLEQNNKSFDVTYSLDPEKIATYVKSCEAYNTEPVDAVVYTTDQMTPGVDGGTDGITLDEKGAEDTLSNIVSDWDGQSAITVDLPVERVKPEISADDFQLTDVLGSATTDFSASSSARWANVENGCRLISGTLMYPGDYFSVTSALVPFTAENGYQMAPSYEENQVVESYGGGICQVSTTLYNAVLKAELEVTERHNHTMMVHYVDPSKDAAIAEGVMDFNFVNTLDDPVYIIGYCYNGLITFDIYGHETRPSNRTLEFESRTTATIDPEGTKLAADPGQPVGYINQTQSPQQGLQAELWKNIYVDGQLTDSVQVNSSYYNAVGTVYSVGVASDNPTLTQAMYSAIGQNSLEAVQQVIANAASYSQQTEAESQAESQQTDGQQDGGGQGPVTDAATGDMDEAAAGAQDIVTVN